ncbi:hypothetical protein Tco_0714963 [Tanacetum coccineum]
MISTKAWISLLMLLKDIINAVKDDPIANPKINEATETFTTISSNIPEVLSLVKGFDFSALLSMESKQKDNEQWCWGFWRCGFSRQVLDNLKVLAGIPQVVPSIDAIVDFLAINGKRRTTKAVIAKLVVAASTYVIWQERN